MRLWTMDTGGGPGDPANYCDYRTRVPENFSRYNNQFGPLLTWIYMKDKDASGALSGLYNIFFIYLY